MKRKGVKVVIKELLKDRDTWTPKSQIFMHALEWGYSPETIGRSLRKMAESGDLQVSYYDGKWAKGLARYALNEVKPTPIRFETITLADGRTVEIPSKDPVRA